ncbi:MAG: transglutaminase-like domain-containing protein [Pseudomonadota bacterium]
MAKSETVSVTDNPGDWIRGTQYIDKDHLRIQAVALDLSSGHRSDRDKVLAIFQFVRDRIKFGFTRGFWDNKASDVLASRIGYCNTKSTLFVALLRAIDIPARQVFVDIDAQVLYGLVNPGTPYVDHSYVEVYIDGVWVATDAYIVDADLFEPAQVRVRAEGHLMGYGVHATGVMEWDGRSPAFSQFNMLDPRPIGTKHWGVYRDVADFYRRADRSWNRLNPLLRASMGAFSSSINQRADRLRAS